MRCMLWKAVIDFTVSCSVRLLNGVVSLLSHPEVKLVHPRASCYDVFTWWDG